LAHVETYWEFGASDALLAFAGLERWLSAAAPNITQTQRADLITGRDRAARWIKFEARKGVDIAAYAKASSRLRLEIRHYQRNGQSIGQILPPGSQFSTTTTLLERIERLRDDAASRINFLLRRVPLTPLIQSAATAEAFATVLSEVSRVCTRHRSLLPVIFSQLVASGGVNTERGSGLFNACLALCRSGVLERARVVPRRPSIQFVLAEPYRAAVDGLRSFLAAQAEAATPSSDN
jgi:hypothetical protein